MSDVPTTPPGSDRPQPGRGAPPKPPSTGSPQQPSPPGTELPRAPLPVGQPQEPLLSPEFDRSQKQKRGHRVRRGAGAGVLAVVVASVVWLKVGGDNPLPAGVPLVGRD